MKIAERVLEAAKKAKKKKPVQVKPKVVAATSDYVTVIWPGGDKWKYLDLQGKMKEIIDQETKPAVRDRKLLSFIAQNKDDDTVLSGEKLN